MVDIAKLQALAAEKGENQTEAQAGGGGTFELPDEGPGGCRLISYIEIGKHTKQFKGDKPKEVEQVILEFELVGKRWPATNSETGREKPFVIRITENKSLNEKANFFKLFSRLNYGGKAKHFCELVGQEFKCTIVHSTSGEGDEKKTYANLRDSTGYTIVPRLRTLMTVRVTLPASASSSRKLSPRSRFSCGTSLTKISGMHCSSTVRSVTRRTRRAT